MTSKKLVIAGIVITGVGLALLGYLDPVIRIIFFGQPGLGLAGGSPTATGTNGFAGNFTGGVRQFAGRAAGPGTASLVSVATIIVFVATVIGLLLTIAGSFAAGRPFPTGAGPSPAAKAANPSPGEAESRRLPSATRGPFPACGSQRGGPFRRSRLPPSVASPPVDCTGVFPPS